MRHGEFSGLSRAPAARPAFVFVCQAGEWELKAALLAASLRRRYGYDGIELIAAIPQPRESGHLAQDTAALLEQLRFDACRSPIRSTPPSHANKIACLGVETAAAKIVFLDSDMLCLARCDFALEPGAPIAIKLADLPAFPSDGSERWMRRLRRGRAGRCHGGASRCRATPPRRQPFYNSGVIVLDTAFASHCGAAGPRRAADPPGPARAGAAAWSDQLGLAVALDCCRRSRCRSAAAQPSDPPDAPGRHARRCLRALSLAADHRAGAGAAGATASLIEEHPALGDLMRRHAGWTELAKPNPRRHTSSCLPQQERTILITGISRSGTSYLCSLIDAHSNAVGLNETPELVKPQEPADAVVVGPTTYAACAATSSTANPCATR